MSWQAKKQVAVLATSMLMNDKKTKEEKLEWVPGIRYPIIFQDQTEALLDSKSKINAMNPTFTPS